MHTHTAQPSIYSFSLSLSLSHTHTHTHCLWSHTTTDIAMLTVHGIGMSRGSFLAHSVGFHKAGYGVLLFDCRAGSTYGAKEHNDVLAAARFLKNTLHVSKVVVLGRSMGGTRLTIFHMMMMMMIIIITHFNNDTVRFWRLRTQKQSKKALLTPS